MSNKTKASKAGKAPERLAVIAAEAEQEPASAKPERDGMSDRQVLQISRAIADPRRMAMLRAIAQNTTSCSEMRGCMTIGAATLSHHMKQLENAGLIETSKDGRSVQATLQKKVWKSYLSTLKGIAG